MQLAQWTGGKDERISRLPASILYVLSAPSTPQEFVDEVLKRVEHGEQVAASALRTELRTRASYRGRLPTNEGTSLSPLTIDGSIASSCPASFAEAVAILARKLPELEFARIRAIMTDPRVLSDPNLSHTITRSFGRPQTDAALPIEAGYYAHVSGAACLTELSLDGCGSRSSE
jgi:hypothetical protein